MHTSNLRWYPQQLSNCHSDDHSGCKCCLPLIIPLRPATHCFSFNNDLKATVVLIHLCESSSVIYTVTFEHLENLTGIRHICLLFGFICGISCWPDLFIYLFFKMLLGVGKWLKVCFKHIEKLIWAKDKKQSWIKVRAEMAAENCVVSLRKGK